MPLAHLAVAVEAVGNVRISFPLWLNNILHIYTHIHIYIYIGDITLMTESEEELKNLLMRVKEKSERASLKLDI